MVSVKVEVFAKDNKTSDIKTIHVLIKAPIELNASSVKLDQKTLKDNTTIDFKNKYTVKDLEITVPENATATVYRIEDDGLIIRIQHQDKLTVEFFEFTIANERDENLEFEILDALITRAIAIDEDKYTKASYAKLKTATDEDITILNSAASQHAINKAIDSLQNAIHNLVEVEALDTSEIEAILSEYDEAYLAQFTDESVTIYKKKLKL